ncbi:RimK/LysX family protein [Blastopirellula sp. JC732]|uniref:RimK/LysX family protein n=1 Tax=Blastopirellula sediminis TaxID=2894196 RepID=A0A9X1MQP8_9BACT|nr:RimK/LysX family protein [Blastopirellula sediminis]MCC9604972.1 RimK/LysX family protein [Blastopirellula sediminis]MCC9631728.1 RimK/LysX family protein [Blastopirellula sediminis]
MTDQNPNSAVIGWQEYVALPEWNVPPIRAKSDSGARSSAIDVVDFEELPGDRVLFHVALSKLNRDNLVTIEAPIKRRTRIKSSNGSVHDRIIVETTIKVGEHEALVELGLVCRKTMLCRMLLGRTALVAGRFLVNSEKRYLLSQKPASTKHKKRRPGKP